ncbi:Sialidase precursor [Gemmata sp. SH-PL17]|uniref:sialidase family protein n=1 Tax=Gemmata sp. SH-PL17 TaxID=1630693 RepID=UPI00078BD841|nr:sialidase family protein [Gemmata sp. SH-PL17]AMV28186.1 Sialidase precursor [Gemmata sp. SH-PL17]
MTRFALVLVLAAFSVPAFAAEPEKIDLFDADRGGYKQYRIPGIVVTKSGVVLAYCEARKSARGDWGEIDILFRRSADGGKTWDEPKKIADVPGPKEKNPVALAQKLANKDDVTYNNPVMIADKSGAVHLLFCLEYMRCFYARSDDYGKTWTAPTEITASAFDPIKKGYDWKVLATGPGHGIQLKSGRLLCPVWLSLGTGGHAHRPSVVTTIFSDDAGKTWKAGEIAVPHTAEYVNPNESCVAELSDGTVVLNARSESKNNRRLVTHSADGATKWSKPVFDDALVEPVCVGSILVLPGKKPLLLFSNPDNLEKTGAKVPPAPGSGRDRKNLTVRLSEDNGKTWAAKRSVESGFSAYSDLAATKDGPVLLFYERAGEKGANYGRLTLARFGTEWIREK